MRSGNYLLNAVYDLDVSYPCFDFLCFAAHAERERRICGADAIRFVFVPATPGRKREFEFVPNQSDWLMRNVVIASCAIVPTCASFVDCDTRAAAQTLLAAADEPVFPVGYTVANPVEGWLPVWTTLYGAMGEEMHCLSAAPQARAYIRAWMDSVCRDAKAVTITVRHARHHPERNADEKQWSLFAKVIASEGYVPIIVPDTDVALLPLPPEFDSFLKNPTVAFNVELRTALYEESFINVFGMGGATTISDFNKQIRFLQFRDAATIGDADGFQRFHGYRYRGGFPHAHDYQQVNWSKPSLDSMLGQFRSMANLIESRLAEGTYHDGLRPNPANHEPITDLARRFLRYGQWRPFDAALDWLRSTEPKGAATCFLAAAAEAQRHAGLVPDEAFAVLAERTVDAIEQISDGVFEKNPTFAGDCGELADLFIASKAIHAAERLCRHGIEVGGGSPDTYRRLSAAYLKQGNLSRAIDCLDVLARHDQATAQDYLDLAAAYEARGGNAEAIQIYRSSIDSGIISAKVMFHLGNAYKRVGDLENAVIAFEWLRDRGLRDAALTAEINALYVALGRARNPS